jgi:6-phosphogluconolactonase
MTSEIHILANTEELASTAAEAFIDHAQHAVRAQGAFTVALSGGLTPKRLYQLLAREAIAASQAPVGWEKVHFFWGDERHVPPDHTDSNYRMAYEALLSKVPVPPEHVYRVPAETSDANQAAERYEQMLRDFFRLGPEELPRFDLVLLGLGTDGHVASLFPATAALHEQEHLVIANWVEKLHVYRITLTLPVINNAAGIVFLVSGTEKAETLRRVLEGDHDPERYPAQRIRPKAGHLLWLVDTAAAAHLQITRNKPFKRRSG